MQMSSLIRMYTQMNIKRCLPPLVLVVLLILGWVIYLHSPSDHTKPVLSLTSVLYLTHSLKSLPIGEMNNGSSLQSPENKEDVVTFKDNKTTYYPIENGIETNKILEINKGSNTSDEFSNSSLIVDIFSNSLQDDNSTSFQNVSSVKTLEANKLKFESTWTRVLERRQERVVEVCRQNLRQLKRIWGYGNLLYDTKHHLAYCRTAKAGTTWWLGSLLWWSDVPTVGLTPDAIHQVANQVFPTLNTQEIKVQLDAKPFIFMAVRHPFTRLISAYRDKISSGYRKDLYPQMISSYRKNYTKASKSGVLGKTENRSDFPTFREFVLFAAQQVNHCALVPNSACMLEVDVHWRPAHDRCAPCDVHYDAIIKLETFDSDERYIKLITGMPLKQHDKIGPFQNSHNAKTGQTTEDLIAEYFNNLTPEEVNTVIKAYYYDFLLFGYDPYY